MKLNIAGGLRAMGFAALCATASPAAAQQASDRGDAGVAERELSARPDPRPAFTTSSSRVAPDASTAPLAADILVGAIVVDGAASLRAAQFAPLFPRYLGRPLRTDDLKAIARDVADLARARGLVFASAWVPAQTVSNGVLRVRLDEGRIDEVRVAGGARTEVEPVLAVLADGRPVTRSGLERALLLAGDVPGVTVSGTRYAREGSLGVLHVDTAARRVSHAVQIDNWGSRAVGPIRVRLRTDVNGALFYRDQLSLRATVTPIRPSELATVGFDYSANTGLDGLMAGVGASYTRVAPGAETRRLEIDGRSTSLNANLSYPLKRSLDANLWATADFTVRDVEQDRAETLVRDDRFTTLTLGVSGYRKQLGGWLYARAQARQGLDLFDATRRGDPMSSRPDGSALFTKLDAYADWTGPIAGALSLRVAAEGQIASRALLSSEEMGIGGPRFGRAYDYSERSGDHGVAGLAELRYDLKGLPIAGRTTQVYAFADAGWVGNRGSGGRGGSLYSAGGGVRFDLSKVFDAGVEAGFPIGNDRYETGDRKPRLSFTLSARF